MAAKERTTAAIATAALLAALTGCVASPPATPTPSATMSATPAPTTPSAAERDLERATDTVRRMWALVDELTNKPKATSISDLDDVASGSALEELQNMLMGYRAQGWIGTGSTQVKDVTTVSSGPNSEGRSTWTVKACVDRSQTTLKDADGVSMQVPPYRIAHRWTVVERDRNFYVMEHEATGTC